VNRKKSGASMELSVVLRGDRRLAENVILEVRAIAERCGLEPPSIRVTRQPLVGAKAPKAKKPSSRRKPGS
jgi:hypothetical protein